MSTSSNGTICLFDVDGTLTVPRGVITDEMGTFLKELKSKGVEVGIVGGSDLVKQKEQLGEDVLDLYRYNFSQNGLVAYENGELVGCTSLNDHLGEENIKAIVNWCLRYLADVDIPVKRGTFVEYRTGMMNISPIGRNCSREERNAFEEYDNQAKVREKMVDAMKAEFEHLDMTFSIGGQISFDVFPRGWDKTYCLKYVPESFTNVHFFGDKTHKGGNDHEIYEHPRTQGHAVKGPEDTMRICKELFF